MLEVARYETNSDVLERRINIEKSSSDLQNVGEVELFQLKMNKKKTIYVLEKQRRLAIANVSVASFGSCGLVFLHASTLLATSSHAT